MLIHDGVPLLKRKDFYGVIMIFFALFFLSSCYKSSQVRSDLSSDPNELNEGGFSYDDAASKLEMGIQPKKKVFVFDFWNDTPVDIQGLGHWVADELQRELVSTGRVIHSEGTGKTWRTEDYVQGTGIKVAQLIRDSQKLDAFVIVLGRISKVIFRQKGDEVGLFRKKESLAAVEVEIKLFDLSSGREVMAVIKSGEASSHAYMLFNPKKIETPAYREELIHDAFFQTLPSFVPELLKSIAKIQWQGKIAKIVGTKVYINAGRSSGLIQGDILKVSHEGEEIYDVATGVYLGHAQPQLKGTLEVIGFIGSDGTSARVHTGGNFKEGDVVQLY